MPRKPGDKDRPANTKRRQCTARSKRSGEQCRRDAMHGQLVCYMHGGNTPAAKEKAQRKIDEDRARAEAKRAVEKLGMHDNLPHADPLEGLLNEIAASAAAVEFYAAKVRSLTDDDAAFDDDDEDYRPGAGKLLESTMFGPQPHVWVGLWTAERERHAKLCAAGIRAGLAERQVRVNEMLGQTLVAVVIFTLDHPDLELSAAKRERGRQIAAEQIRAARGLGA